MTRRNQRKKAENTQKENASPSAGDHSSLPSREQGLMENECIPITEMGFRSTLQGSSRQITETQEFNTSLGNMAQRCIYPQKIQKLAGHDTERKGYIKNSDYSFKASEKPISIRSSY
ncbi:hypothetical protein AAY473_027363 [Plecturocebus cupreus]